MSIITVGFGARSPARRYRPRIGTEPARTVVLLGAGASAEVGCPVMRGFIDRARDLLTGGPVTQSEADDLRRALGHYADMQQRLRITEEDIENVENLLALADLEEITLRGMPSRPSSQRTFGAAVDGGIVTALAGPSAPADSHNLRLLPVTRHFQRAGRDYGLLAYRLRLEDRELTPDRVDWCEVVARMRRSPDGPKDPSSRYAEIAQELHLDYRPPDAALPADGSGLGAPRRTAGARSAGEG